ncbi:hypothetical protein BGX27_009779 [Mortierella sp. AM989]|nr:hypothetical protein BGX27_009779 [Mortierella sp. AM989]
MQASRATTHLRGLGLHSNGTECFANLQPLEYDPEPLLNERTIDSILKAGKTVVLTREYTGLKNERRKNSRMRSYSQEDDGDDDDSCFTDTDPADETMDVGEVEVGSSENRRMARAIRTGAPSSYDQDASSDMDSSSSRYDSEGSYFPPVESTKPKIYANSAFTAAHSKSGYADFVQGLNPTWSQSPAPSPNIIKEDPTINPFFFQLESYPAMDDDAFNPPDPTPESTEDDHSSASDQFRETPVHSHSSLRPQPSTPASQTPPSLPTSALSNSRSLIHVPLYRSTDHNNHRYLPSDIRSHRPPAMPIGIISILSDQVPYPPEALDVLTELNPFLANQVTNALRLEDMVARSSRWGDISALSERSRGSETFAESVQRKMKDSSSDIATPRPSGSNQAMNQTQDYHYFNSIDKQYTRSKQSTNRRSTEPTIEKPAVNADQRFSAPQQSSKKSSYNKGNDLLTSRSHQVTSKRDGHSIHASQNQRGLPKSSKSRATEPDVVVASEAKHGAFDFLSPDLERLDQDAGPSVDKQPETCFNLDSTTDEIHRSLNILNLDVTGSATCPLAPQTKKMLGRQHHSPRSFQSLHVESTLASSWYNDRHRTESSPSLADTEDLEGPDGMWQTLQTEEPDLRAKSLPNSRIINNEFEVAGGESPYFGSIHSISPSSAPKRHLFSTSKRSGIRRRRKSFKEQSKSQQSQFHPSDSPVPNSPYTPTMPGFHSHQSEISSGNSSFGVPIFSPDPSPIASPTVHQSGMFNQTFSSMGLGLCHESNSCSKSHLNSHGHSRAESGKDRVPLSRQGSGWSFNSDDTNLASPGLQGEKNHAGRKHKKKHSAFSSERTGVNPFPRTRLLRLIVDSISHHVFTLSPQSGCLTWLNQRSLQYTGLPLAQLLHTSWTRLLHEDDRATFQPLFKDCFDRGDSFNAQYRVRRFDGQYRWFLGRILPVRDCGGNIVHWFGTSTDIHDQKLAELQLNRQVELEINEKKYRLLAEAIPQIVFTATPQSGLTYANAKWFTYSGQVFEQTSGLGFMDHVHPEDRAKCFLPTNISEDNGATPEKTASESDPQQATSPGTTFGQGPGEVSYQTEMRLLRKDGKYRWFLVKCISVEVVEQGRKWFGTCTDINDQKLLEHKLKEAHDAAKKSTESKTRFLSNMSHEIRTPLVGITGMINFLITTDLTSEQLDYVHTVQQSAEALLLVINDILDLSKVEAGMMKLEMEPFSVHHMIEGANELLSTLAIQKGLELGFLVEDDVPDIVIGDRVRLRQVLINIIGNAIKFTTDGEVFSRCSLVAPKPNSDPELLTIRFEISDTGKGFDESERAVMFKPFSQVDTSSTRKHGGTGLGLVLSKEFVELHGGKIQCESIKGQGSKFSFTFVARVSPLNSSARATTPVTSDDARMSELMRSRTTEATLKNIIPLLNASGPKLVIKPPVKPPVRPSIKSPVKPTNSKEARNSFDPMLLRHVTGLKLIPGEMCFAEPDYEDTKKTASKALEVATQKIKRGEFATADATLETGAEDEKENNQEQLVQPKQNKQHECPADDPTSESPQREVCTAMTRTESILDDRRYLKVGQLTPSNPPMGEPASVAIIAANLPNPAADMKLAIPAKILENKALAAESKKAVAAATSLASSMQHSRPDLSLSDASFSSSSSSSFSTVSSVDSKLSTSTATSSSGSLTATGVAVTATEQPRILVIADFPHARETILHLINQLVPKELNPIMDVATDLKEGIDFLVGGRKEAMVAGKYNHLVINLASYMSVMDIFSVLQQDGVLVEANVVTCVITTPIHRAALMEAIKVEEASMEFVKVTSVSRSTKVIPDKVEWVFKPLTKTKLYVAFADIVTHHENVGRQDGSEVGTQDRPTESSKISVKRRTAHQVVIDQKEIFSQMHDAMEGKNIRILLAEDDLTNQKVIRRYFQKVGADLVIANDGNECLDKFTKHPKGHFSLVLCDLFMPGKDGYEATRAIRDWENEHLEKDERRIPIVALSANVMANVAEQCLNSGFTSYLSKPVDFKKLSETLRQYIL